ncbi:MAG: alanine racemase [Bacillota bacterium]
MEFVRRTWAEIDLNALDYNMQQIQETVTKGAKSMTVLKADAYGHGDAFVAKRVEQGGFCDWFGVSNVEEAISLRNAKIEKPILILGYTPVDCVELLKQYDLTQAVISKEYAVALEELARTAGVTIDVHVKVDTGMSRIGFMADEENFEISLADIIEIAESKVLHLKGIFTHHSVADAYSAEHEAFTKRQFERFQKMVESLKERKVDVGICHCANSATTIAYKEKHIDMCRTGIITYGLLPSPECKGMIDLRPLMTLKTVVGMVKTVPDGAELSYGRTYCAKGERRIASLPIGYADGYNRNLSNRARVLIHGQFAPVVGRVCMDQMMIDVTDIPDVKMGDEVVLFGKQGEAVLPIEELADILQTINYELPCVLTKRVPRVYLNNGKIVGVVNHLARRYE